MGKILMIKMLFSKCSSLRKMKQKFSNYDSHSDKVSNHHIKKNFCFRLLLKGNN